MKKVTLHFKLKQEEIEVVEIPRIGEEIVLRENCYTVTNVLHCIEAKQIKLLVTI